VSTKEQDEDEETTGSSKPAKTRRAGQTGVTIDLKDILPFVQKHGKWAVLLAALYMGRDLAVAMVTVVTEVKLLQDKVVALDKRVIVCEGETADVKVWMKYLGSEVDKGKKK
jgi:hypothetical protein